MCTSAIAWSGFDNLYYLFSYEDTRDAFGIPHILEHVFGCKNGGYASRNAYWSSFQLVDLVKHDRWADTLDELRRSYAELLDRYLRPKPRVEFPSLDIVWRRRAPCLRRYLSPFPW